jgi:hypothetical protein
LKREKYKDIFIEYSDEQQHHDHEMTHHTMHPQLRVAGKNVHVMVVGHNLYNSHLLPYDTFDNLLDLGKGLYDRVPIFQEKEKLVSD